MFSFLNSTDPKAHVYVLLGFIVYLLLPLPLSSLLNKIKHVSYYSYMDAFTILSCILLGLFIIALPIDAGIDSYQNGTLNLPAFIAMALFFWALVFGVCYLCHLAYLKKHPARKKKK